MKSEVLKSWLCIIYPVALIGLLVYISFFQEKNITISYPEIKTSKVTYNPIFHIIEMPRHEIDVVEVYKDANNNEHQVYVDSLIVSSDSLELKIKPTIDVNIVTRKAVWNWGKIEIKTFEKVITNYIEVPKEITKFKELPFYRNDWFWNWFATTILFLGSLAAIILG